MKINEILNEAGEPENPSRRGFLKALGAAGVAAAMPGTAMKALAEPAAAAEVPAAASAVAPAAVEANLLSDLTNYVWNSGISIPVQELMSDKDLENYQDELEDEGEIIWNPDIDLSEPSKNGGGYTPWGEFYTFQTSPGGVPYIFTGAGYEHPYTAYVAYRDPKTGEIVTDSIYYDSTSHNYNWEDFDLEWEDENDTGEMIDRIIAGEYGEESRDSYWHDEITTGAGKSRKEREEEEMERWWKEYNETHKPYRVYNKHTGEIEKVINATDDQDAIEKLVNYKGQYWQYDPAKHEMFSAHEHLHGPHVGGQRPPERKIDIHGAGTTPADIARLAGLAKRGYDAAMSAGGPEQPRAAELQKPQALPAPQKPDIDLTPDLKQKQKQQEPVKRNKDENK